MAKELDWKREMSLFRYTVIGPLLHLEDGISLKGQMQNLAKKFWTLPDGTVRQFAWGTIEEWYYKYRNGGLEALELTPRRDQGNFRHLPLAIRDEIDTILKEHPEVRTSTILTVLRHQGKLTGESPSESTIYRYVKIKRPAMEGTSALKDRRAFEAPYSGSLWQTDILYGPYFQCRGKDGRIRKQRSYLVAIIDDHSRLLCHGHFYFEQNELAYLDCLKQAVQKRGCPERIYCDNGKVFLSSQIKRIMAKIGTTISHCPIRDGSAKGKIEKFFRTCRDQFLEVCSVTGFPKTIEELNQRFAEWYEGDYNTSHHQGINTTPVKKWMATAYKLKLLSPHVADDIFTFEDTRKVKNDGTFSLGGKLFETHSALAGKKITINYDPFFPERVFVSCEDREFGRANLLDRQFNSSKPRRKLQKEDIING